MVHLREDQDEQVGPRVREQALRQPPPLLDPWMQLANAPASPSRSRGPMASTPPAAKGCVPPAPRTTGSSVAGKTSRRPFR